MSTLHGQLNPWSSEDLEQIHQASLSILEKTGVQVHSEKILDILESSDAQVDRDSRVVRFLPDMVDDRMRNAPGSQDRNPRKAGEFTVGVDASRAWIWDYANHRPRPTVARDLLDVPRVVEAMPNFGEAGASVFVDDIPASMRDMILCRHQWNHSQKQGGGGLGRSPGSVLGLSPKAYDYLYEMLAVKLGGVDKVAAKPQLSFFMGIASPLRWGQDVLEMALHVVNRGQLVGIGGNCISGIQSPITPAANIALDHAERLSGMCIVTSMRADAAFYFCNHTYALDMCSGNVAVGAPSHTLQALLGEKLLQHCGFHLMANHPIMDVGGPSPDAQITAEKMMYMLLTALGGSKGIGGAGHLNETFCYEQLIIDNDIAGYVKQLIKGADINEETIALETIHEYGIGGNFLDSEPTLKFMRDCYYPPELFYRKRRSEWLREGSKELFVRAHEKLEEILASDTPTFLSDEQLSSMDKIILEACCELAPDWDPKPYLKISV